MVEEVRKNFVPWARTASAESGRLVKQAPLSRQRMANKDIEPLHPAIKELLGYTRNQTGREVIKHWRSLSTRVCKPCWEPRYCPYGPLVEDAPLLPPVRQDAVEHNEYLKQCLRSGRLADGRPVTSKKRKILERMVQEFNADEYRQAIPAVIAEMQCTVFGHICPVVYAAEAFTETAVHRRTGRYIPFRTEMRVVGRDNYTCQHCQKHLKDNEVEFDHIIPFYSLGEGR